jgi:hypothetical protein
MLMYFLAELHAQLTEHFEDHTQSIAKKIPPPSTPVIDDDETQEGYDREWKIFSDAISRLDRLFPALDSDSGWVMSQRREGNDNIETVRNVCIFPTTI